jgi:hypothetical protein
MKSYSGPPETLGSTAAAGAKNRDLVQGVQPPGRAGSSGNG